MVRLIRLGRENGASAGLTGNARRTAFRAELLNADGPLTEIFPTPPLRSIVKLTRTVPVNLLLRAARG